VAALLFVPFKQWLDRSRREHLVLDPARSRGRNELK